MLNSRSTREEIFATLYDLMCTAAPPAGLVWGESGRRLKGWDEVPPANQPARFMNQGTQESSQPTFGVSQWKLNATWWIYFRADTSVDQIPDQLINSFLDNICAVIEGPRAGDRQTLNGLVYHCWIDGEIVIDNGVIDQQGVIVVPIGILVGA